MYTNDKIYTGTRITGGIKRFKMLYEGLVKKGYDVTLYCGENPKDLKKYNSNAYSILRDKEKTKFFSSFGIFWRNRKTLKKIKNEKYDHVIVFDIPTCIGLCLRRIKNIDLFLRQDIVEYRKVILNEKKHSYLYKRCYLTILKFCEYLCCKHSKKIILQCQYDLNNLMNRHYFTRKKIKNKSYVQINNVNAPWIVENSNIKERPIIESGKTFKLCFVGDFLNNRKGHDIFLSAVKELIDAHYNVNSYIIGDGKLLDEEKEKYKKYHNIFFLGRLDNPILVIKQCDLVVVPSRADSCPNTVLESIYNNVLVIGSRVGGIPELLVDNECLFDLNANDLTDKIMSIIDDKNKYIALLNKELLIKEDLSFDWTQKIIDILEINK